MSTPITISLYYNGRQKDFEAIFTNSQSACEFKVKIDDKFINFEGGLQEPFHVKNDVPARTLQQVDSSVLEAVKEQLNQIFF